MAPIPGWRLSNIFTKRCSVYLSEALIQGGVKLKLYGTSKIVFCTIYHTSIFHYKRKLNPKLFYALKTDNVDQNILTKFQAISMCNFGEKQSWNLGQFPYMKVRFPYKEISKNLKTNISKTIHRNCLKFGQKIFLIDIFNFEE